MMSGKYKLLMPTIIPQKILGYKGHNFLTQIYRGSPMLSRISFYLQASQVTSIGFWTFISYSTGFSFISVFEHNFLIFKMMLHVSNDMPWDGIYLW